MTFDVYREPVHVLTSRASRSTARSFPSTDHSYARTTACDCADQQTIKAARSSAWDRSRGVIGAVWGCRDIAATPVVKFLLCTHPLMVCQLHAC